MTFLNKGNLALFLYILKRNYLCVYKQSVLKNAYITALNAGAIKFNGRLIFEALLREPLSALVTLNFRPSFLRELLPVFLFVLVITFWTVLSASNFSLILAITKWSALQLRFRASSNNLINFHCKMVNMIDFSFTKESINYFRCFLTSLFLI